MPSETLMCENGRIRVHESLSLTAKKVLKATVGIGPVLEPFRASTSLLERYAPSSRFLAYLYYGLVRFYIFCRVRQGLARSGT